MSGDEHSLESARAPTVILNADDWGLCARATDRILDCIERRAISSTSAMVFMADSERAAELARARGVDAGLHLNLTAEFDGAGVSPALMQHQERVAPVLCRNRFAPRIFHPLLAPSFDYLVKAQLDEYARLFGEMPQRVDGHHHMHLCANVLRQNLLPAGIVVRRNFTFRAGEKSAWNRLFRGIEDKALRRRHRITDYFFDLVPMEAERLRGIFALARNANVEVEAHPGRDAEYEYLVAGRLQEAGPVTVLSGYVLRNGAEHDERQA